MPLTLIATVGATNANSYQTAAAAQALFDTMPNASAWTAADVATRDQALVWATTLLEALAYLGTKVSSPQALAFPRYGVADPDFGASDDTLCSITTIYLDSTTIPRRMLRAHVALTLEILRAGTADIWGQDALANIKSDRVGSLATEYFDRRDQKRGLRAFPQVWREVYPLLAVSAGVSVSRG